jgi:hypothetical protein
MGRNYTRRGAEEHGWITPKFALWMVEIESALHPAWRVVSGIRTRRGLRGTVLLPRTKGDATAPAVMPT